MPCRRSISADASALVRSAERVSPASRAGCRGSSSTGHQQSPVTQSWGSFSVVLASAPRTSPVPDVERAFDSVMSRPYPSSGRGVDLLPIPVSAVIPRRARVTVLVPLLAAVAAVIVPTGTAQAAPPWGPCPAVHGASKDTLCTTIRVPVDHAAVRGDRRRPRLQLPRAVSDAVCCSVTPATPVAAIGMFSLLQTPAALRDSLRPHHCAAPRADRRGCCSRAAHRRRRRIPRPTSSRRVLRAHYRARRSRP